ncbi:alpha/beta fold hydrolase [Acinetobacter ihumii]|uniref:alpha/beta fold hydrolase n=1 Tax=Acinetobacter ihumii TaxID=2483802 RepID=UPI00102F404B|nr:alpha/beta fold hydrolase [Acinetobacter ihumii]
MILNTHIVEADHASMNKPVVLLHGLFGSLSNLGVIARALSTNHKIIQMDLRNHGLSPHSDEMNYEIMAQDVVDTLDELGIDQFSLIGHSMGGKVSMKIAGLYPNRVDKLIILDVSPVAYQGHRHRDILDAINAVRAEPHELSRKQATEIMKKYIPQDGVIMFLLKSFNQGHWLFNVDALEKQYPNLTGWNDIQAWNKPCLFIQGAKSEYIQPEYEQVIRDQFPNAEIKTIEGVGHWLHAEKPEEVVGLIQTFLSEQGESRNY